jgi:hypothetical protein
MHGSGSYSRTLPYLRSLTAQPLTATPRITKGLADKGDRCQARDCTVIHRKALEKTCSEAENGLAGNTQALKYFFGGSTDATHM